MADKIPQLILDALQRAAAEPAGLPLQAARAAPGLFPAHPQARQAAQLCKDEGYLRVVRTDAKGKNVQEICALSEKGLAYLLGQVSPKQVLEGLLRAIEASQTHMAQLVEAARHNQETFKAFHGTIEKILLHHDDREGTTMESNGSSSSGKKGSNDINQPSPTEITILTCLSKWQEMKSLQDCPLPELYQWTKEIFRPLSLGAFHDSLRHLHAKGKVLLHPWTGPLYDLPEPTCALLVGHEIAFYASIRT